MRTGRNAKFVLFAALGLMAPRAWGDTTLFTTQQDFTGWAVGNPFTAVASTVGDSDASTIDGVGNTTTPGGSGTAGALNFTHTGTGGYDSMLSYGEQGNSGFLAALGSSGTMKVDETVITAPTGGSYDQLLLLLNYNSHFDTFSPTVTTAGGFNTLTYNYTFAGLPASGAYLQVGFVLNTDRTGGTFSADNFRIVPEPASLSLLGLGGLLTLRCRRRA
jgi:PEP-CTERM motif